MRDVPSGKVQCVSGRHLHVYPSSPRQALPSRSQGRSDCSHPFSGLLTRFHAHPAAWLHKIPDSISFEEGALLEPLCVALAGIDRSGLRLGDPLFICGAGPIGLVTLLAAQAAGAAPIAISDLDRGRLEFAKKLVPRVKTVLVEKGVEPKGMAEKVKEAMGVQPLIAIDCTGAEPSIATAIYVRLCTLPLTPHSFGFYATEPPVRRDLLRHRRRERTAIGPIHAPQRL